MRQVFTSLVYEKEKEGELGISLNALYRARYRTLYEDIVYMAGVHALTVQYLAQVCVALQCSCRQQVPASGSDLEVGPGGDIRTATEFSPLVPDLLDQISSPLLSPQSPSPHSLQAASARLSRDRRRPVGVAHSIHVSTFQKCSILGSLFQSTLPGWWPHLAEHLAEVLACPFDGYDPTRTRSPRTKLRQAPDPVP
ncbi:hypothetical protein G7Y89_g1083 [Cudoniella acicularis]|uniref:Uncharacterized protein n=1 Tax=Cudoniella acicularis TaxID=354080 RepID=A0A8H4RXY0_9HELO|nr:hypothetical protein G7Y89_g1083 [Cudoniella acicularis]